MDVTAESGVFEQMFKELFVAFSGCILPRLSPTPFTCWVNVLFRYCGTVRGREREYV